MGIWLIGCVVCFVLGFVVGFVYLVIVLCCVIYKVFGYVAHKVFVFVKKPICIMKDRKKTLSSIPDLDMSLVNNRNVLSHFSYGNKLLRLYRGPNRRGYLYVPKGTESIGEHAFDDFLMDGTSKETERINENITEIVLPSTIRELDVDNIPRESVLVFANARSKSILRNNENYLKSKEIEIKGGLFSKVLRECETLEHDHFDFQKDNYVVAHLLEHYDIDRLNAALSQITDPSLKIELMDRFHALILSGDMSIPDFEYLLEEVDFEPKDRYYGKDVIEKIYGSVEDAYTRFEAKYYESENIRTQERIAEDRKTKFKVFITVAGLIKMKRNRTAAKNIFKTIDFVESVAKDPSAFLTDNGDRSEAQGDDVSKVPLP